MKKKHWFEPGCQTLCLSGKNFRSELAHIQPVDSPPQIRRYRHLMTQKQRISSLFVSTQLLKKTFHICFIKTFHDRNPHSWRRQQKCRNISWESEETWGLTRTKFPPAIPQSTCAHFTEDFYPCSVGFVWKYKQITRPDMCCLLIWQCQCRSSPLHIFNILFVCRRTVGQNAVC